MKRLAIILSAAVLLFALSACGAKSPEATQTIAPTETPDAAPTTNNTESPDQTDAPEETPPDSELTDIEQAKQEILAHVDEAYAGVTPANAPMYFMADEEGKYVVLLLENTDGQSYIMFDGEATIDESSGILTVTDSDTGYAFGFAAEEQADGTFFLDCGDLGEASLQAAEPESVVDAILETIGSMEDVTEAFFEALSGMSVMDSLDIAYAGLTDAEEPVYFLASSDGTIAALVIADTNGAEYIRFIGSAAEDEESGVTTVMDGESGHYISFIAELQEDDSLILDCGELGAAYLEPSDTETVLTYMGEVFMDMADVTDALVAALAG